MSHLYEAECEFLGLTKGSLKQENKHYLKSVRHPTLQANILRALIVCAFPVIFLSGC